MSDSTLTLISLPYAEAVRMYRAAKRSDADAIAYFKGLWPQPGDCFLCGRPLGPGEGSTTILPDPPNAKVGMVMLGRQCDACAGLTWVERQRRVIRLMKAMYPGWHPHGPPRGVYS